MRNIIFALIPLLAAATVSAAPVEESVARAVAEERVAAFFPGETWRAVDGIAAVDDMRIEAQKVAENSNSAAQEAASGSGEEAAQAAETEIIDDLKSCL